MKKLKVLLFVLIIVVVGMGIFIYMLLADKLPTAVCSCPNCEANTLLSQEKLADIKKSDFNILESYYTQYNSISLLTNGKIVFDLDREINNISNAIHMEVLDKDLYILTANGEVYKYYLGITKEPNLSAEKLDYSNITKLVKYSTRKANAGGCDYIVVVDKSDNYKSINEFCV